MYSDKDVNQLLNLGIPEKTARYALEVSVTRLSSETPPHPRPVQEKQGKVNDAANFVRLTFSLPVVLERPAQQFSSTAGLAAIAALPYAA